MVDYRQDPQGSPVAWCMKHGDFVAAKDAYQLMTTVYKVVEHGVYPFCVCNDCALQSIKLM